MRVILLDGADPVLAGFTTRMGAYARRRLTRLEVEVRLDTAVEAGSAAGVRLAHGEFLPAATVVWTAGVRGEPLAERLGLPLGPDARVRDRPTCWFPARTVSSWSVIWSLWRKTDARFPVWPSWPRSKGSWRQPPTQP